MTETFDSWLSSRTHHKKEIGLHRKLNVMNTRPNPHVIVNGKKELIFSSNNYLGLASDQRLINAASTVLNEFGVGSSGSRLMTGNSIWHKKLEEKIASFKETESSLLFSSGYLANIGALSSLPEKGDVILSDELNHASIIDGCRLSKAKTVIYKHVDMDDLEKRLKETLPYKRRFIITEGVFSMDGNLAPLDKIMSLASAYHSYVMVDDAHGTGILGENGKGTANHFGVKPDLLIGTLSKSVGTEGGFIAGSNILKDFLLNHARTFIFQTAIPPTVCAASLAAIEIIENDDSVRKEVKRKANLLSNKLQELGYVVKGGETPIIPVIIGGANETVSFANKLQENHIFAPAIRPPTVKDGESRIRLTVTAEHSNDDINTILKVFARLRSEVEGII
ncbi:8-amino-7-oxononanoate synthase [Alkalihalobacillus sp. 1P02AB]|uniref:8-amino-7-oxononanoate synthase n=1 Tax=Alkalihalobacillus sp. 1P02AB TaxID=3132260 RepID=UPI0039A5D47F